MRITPSRVIHDGNQFIAAASDTLSRSTDGRVWTTERLPFSLRTMALFRGSVYAEGTTASAPGATVSRLAEGGWMPVAGPFPSTILAMTASAERLIVVGAAGFVALSTDAAVWTIAPPVRGQLLVQVGISGERIVVSSPGSVFASDDAITWTRADVDVGFQRGLACHSTACVGLDARGRLFASHDLRRWDLVEAPETPPLARTVQAEPDGFVAIGEGGFLARSDDGRRWTKEQPGARGGSFVDAAFGNGTFVVLDDTGRPLSSRDGRCWQTAQLPPGGPELSGPGLRQLAYGGGQFVAVGPKVPAYRSADGVKWTRIPGHPEVGELVTYDGKRFVAIPFNGTVRISEDGQSWRDEGRVPFGIDDELVRLVIANGVWLVASDRELYRSTDGRGWQRTRSASQAVLAHDGQQFLLATTGTLELSSDGLRWTRSNAMFCSPPRTLRAIAASSTGVLGADNGGTIWMRGADDGHWTPQAIPIATAFTALVIGDGRAIAFGTAGTIVTSTGW